MTGPFRDLRRDPASWMFLSGLGCFAILLYAFCTGRPLSLQLELVGLMACLVLIFHWQARMHEAESSLAYGLYRRMLGFALAWPVGWLLLVLLCA